MKRNRTQRKCAGLAFACAVRVWNLYAFFPLIPQKIKNYFLFILYAYGVCTNVQMLKRTHRIVSSNVHID